MQTSCSTIGFGTLPAEAAFAQIGALGFTEVEIGVLGAFCPHLDPAAPTEVALETCLEALDRHGLRAVALNTAPRAYCDEPRNPKQLRQVTDRLLRLAAGLGCELIVDIGERRAGTDDELRWAAAVVGEAFRLGRDHHGVTVSVEAPHRGMVAETISETRRLLELVGKDGPGITYDTSHATCGGTPADEGLRAIGERIVRVQARDHRGGDVHFTPGDGEYDWPVLMAFLAENPRPVCLELEFDGRLDVAQVVHEIARAHAFINQMRAS